MFGFLFFGILSVSASSPFIFVSNFGNGYISTYESNGTLLNAQFATTKGGSPQGVLLGADKNLYVSDAANNAVYQFNGTSGTLLKTFASANLTGPNAIVWGPDGNLYVSNNGANQVLSFNGMTGQLIDTFVINIEQPRGLIWKDNNLYVASNNPPAINKYDNKGNFLGVFSNYSSFITPQGLAWGMDGNLYVADAMAQFIVRLNGSTGTFIDIFVPVGHGLMRPIGLINIDGTFFCGDASANVIFRITSQGSVDVFANSQSGVSGPTYLTMGFSASGATATFSNLWILSLLITLFQKF